LAAEPRLIAGVSAMRRTLIVLVLAASSHIAVAGAAPGHFDTAIGCSPKTGVLDVHLVGVEALTLAAKPTTYVPAREIGEHECVLEDANYKIRVMQRDVASIGRYHEVEIRRDNEVIVPFTGLGVCDRGAANFGDCELEWAIAIQIFVRDGKYRVQFTRTSQGR